jgi:phosphonate transport system substrate-binding protein
MIHAASKTATMAECPLVKAFHRKWGRIVPLLLLITTTTFSPLIRAADEALTMGVFPRRDATETGRLFRPMAVYLSKRLGREVKLVTTKNFESFRKAVAEQQYDIVHYNQYHYIGSTKTYRVIAHTEEFGRSAVAGALFVRKDSGITEISQLRGRTIVFGGGRDAMLSYIAPRYLLMRAGLKEEDFRTEIAVNPQNALLALYYKQADAAGGGDIVLEQPLIRDAVDARELRILATTEPLLFLPWAVKRSMPPKLAETIQVILLDLKNSDDGRQVLKSAIMTGIANAVDRDYDPHRKMTTAVFGPQRAAR